MIGSWLDGRGQFFQRAAGQTCDIGQPPQLKEERSLGLLSPAGSGSRRRPGFLMLALSFHWGLRAGRCA